MAAAGRDLLLACPGRCCDHVREEVQVDGPVREATPSLGELRMRREAILQLARRHGAREVRVFGSVARGDAGEGSDVDFLVEMEAGRSLFDLGGLLMDLQDLLGGSVDVVTPASLRERVRARVLREAVPL
ncbi:MAG: nucleotidyltransferase family protein [Pseudonocardiaceae bacterium]